MLQLDTRAIYAPVLESLLGQARRQSLFGLKGALASANLFCRRSVAGNRLG